MSQPSSQRFSLRSFLVNPEIQKAVCFWLIIAGICVVLANAVAAGLVG